MIKKKTKMIKMEKKLFKIDFSRKRDEILSYRDFSIIFIFSKFFSFFHIFNEFLYIFLIIDILL